MATGPGSLLIEVADSALDADAVMTAITDTVRSWVGAGPVFLAMADPLTGGFSGAFTYDVPDAAASAFYEIEMSGSDVGGFQSIARAPDGVSALFASTGGHPEESRRWREVISPLHWGDELRVVVRSGAQVWGYMCLHRQANEQAFAARDVARLAKLMTPVATAFRAAAALATADARQLDTGVVLATVEGRIVDVTGGAQAWLDELGSTTDGRLPLLLSGLCRQTAVGGNAISTTIMTRTGSPVMVEAAPLSGDGEPRIAIVVRAAPAEQVLGRFAAAVRLTARETEVVGCVLRGLSTREIAGELGVSTYTVQAHLTAVFGKTGIGTRRELVSRLRG